MSAVKEPVAGYDDLKTREVIASLTDHSQIELAKIEDYERANGNRREVFDKLRWLRQDEPLRGYDALSSEKIVATLQRADLAALKRVRSYERKFRGRREILEHVDRLHQKRRVPLVSRDSTP